MAWAFWITVEMQVSLSTTGWGKWNSVYLATKEYVPVYDPQSGTTPS